MRTVDQAQLSNVNRGDAAQGEKTLAALAAVAEAVGKLRYGAIHLTIHEGRVVQLDVTERQRFT
jgi:hypothetical protein